MTPDLTFGKELMLPCRGLVSRAMWLPPTSNSCNSMYKGVSAASCGNRLNCTAPAATRHVTNWDRGVYELHRPMSIADGHKDNTSTHRQRHILGMPAVLWSNTSSMHGHTESHTKHTTHEQTSRFGPP